MAKININTDSLKPTRQWVRHKIKEGTNTYRILPPFGENSNGYPYRKYQLVWGLKDPQQGRMRPYTSSLSVDKRCPVVEFVDALQALAKDRADKIIGELKASGVTDEKAISQAVSKVNKGLNQLISDIRPKTIFLYNACDQSGKVGILEVKTTAHKELKKLMMEYINDYSQDPTSLSSNEDDSGVWFNFLRTGEGWSTEYSVQKKQTKQKLDGKVAFLDDRSPLPENVVEHYEDLAYDIHSLYEMNTYDELKAVLAANMFDIIEECPDAKSIAAKLGLLIAKVTTAVSNSEAHAAVSALKSTVSKKVSLNLGSDDDEEDDTAIETSVSNTAVVSDEDDDILAQAQSLLEN